MRVNGFNNRTFIGSRTIAGPSEYFCVQTPRTVTEKIFLFKIFLSKVNSNICLTVRQPTKSILRRSREKKGLNKSKHMKITSTFWKNIQKQQISPFIITKLRFLKMHQGIGLNQLISKVGENTRLSSTAVSQKSNIIFFINLQIVYILFIRILTKQKIKENTINTVIIKQFYGE